MHFEGTSHSHSSCISCHHLLNDSGGNFSSVLAATASTDGRRTGPLENSASNVSVSPGRLSFAFDFHYFSSSQTSCPSDLNEFFEYLGTYGQARTGQTVGFWNGSHSHIVGNINNFLLFHYLPKRCVFVEGALPPLFFLGFYSELQLETRKEDFRLDSNSQLNSESVIFNESLNCRPRGRVFSGWMELQKLPKQPRNLRILRCYAWNEVAMIRRGKRLDLDWQKTEMYLQVVILKDTLLAFVKRKQNRKIKLPSW